MKTKLWILGWWVLSVVTATAQSYTLNEGWKFKQGEVDRGEAFATSESDWQSVVIPHTWNAKDATDDVPGFYRGVGWYRKSLLVDATASDRVVYLCFDGVNQEFELFVNERSVGRHVGGYSRAVFDVTESIRFGQPNLIAVKADNSSNPDIPPLSADFTFFGGMYRNVSVRYVPKVHISQLDYGSEGVYISTPVVGEKEARLEAVAVVRNATRTKEKVYVEQTVFSPDGIVVSQSQKEVQLAPNSQLRCREERLVVKSPQLWSPDSPALYRLKTRLLNGRKEMIYEQNSTFGIRYFDFTVEHGFRLNGKPLKLIGTNRHQCFKDKGWALPDEIHLRDVQLLKEMGGNFLRVSHYPQDRNVMEMCDRLGILTSVEVPIVNAVTESERFLDNSLLQVKEMIRQNYNSPSIVIWAYMNEVMLRPPFKEDSIRHAAYCREVNRQAQAIEDLIRREDPSRRTLIPCHGSLSTYESAGLITIPYLVGWNLYQGWYSPGFEGFGRYLDSFHLKYPNIPTFITEYGADVDDRIHSFKPTRFDYSMEYSNAYHEHYLQAILQRPFVVGATIWNLNDFYSESRGDALPQVNGKGINTLLREPKDVYFLYKSIFNPSPALFIGSRTWNNRAGVSFDGKSCVQPLNIYTNLDEVEVWANGLSLGKSKPVDHVVRVNIPFVEGENRIVAQGISQGKPIYDLYRCNFELIPAKASSLEFRSLNMMLGSDRYFNDREGALCWVPEQEYRSGSFGFVGGKRFTPKTRHGSLPASSLNIVNTHQDPLFQTQRVGLQSFRADVARGRYAVYLYWAELVPSGKVEELVYNLDNNAVFEAKGERAFNVSINGVRTLTNFDVEQQAQGAAVPMVKRFYVDVEQQEGIRIEFEAVKGETILNAIRIVKID